MISESLESPGWLIKASDLIIKFIVLVMINQTITSFVPNSSRWTIHLMTMRMINFSAPPRWRIEPQSRSAIVGESLMVDCQASGKPEPLVLWKKADKNSPSNFKTITSGSRVQILVNGTMYFIEVTSDDGGSYMCEASNAIGTPLSTVTSITVHGNLIFKSRPYYQSTRLSLSILFKVALFME